MESFLNVKKQFLCGTSVNDILWQDDCLHKLYSGNDSLDFQKLLLDNTVKNPLVIKFPLKLSYQLAFTKDLIKKLESKGLEVLDELYTTQCEFLSSPTSISEHHYRHFLLNYNSIECITLKESSRLISYGTTGLCSWQAALALADWCLQNNQILHNKRILELGSGVGLTGLTISLCCEPQKYWFSDCHPAVLGMLQSNISLNIETNKNNLTSKDLNEKIINDKDSILCACGNVAKEICGTCELIYKTIYKNTEIGVLDLPWEIIPACSIGRHLSPDVILAADIVFDASAFEALVMAFCYFLKRKHSCSVLLACTVRNEDTLDSFMKLLSSAGLKIHEEQLLPSKYILYSTIVPIRLYKITV
ncbi:Protein-lysine N-methyltransferase EEF2KMT [Blattella germanica]|nr:Protein-lysine N-methyltransferase EEF2KMT [Blattella germanica]